MKTVLTLTLTLLALAPVQAQVFGPRATNGVFWGGVTGAVIGRNSGSLGHNAWRGAAYGAGAGLIFGSYADRSYLYRSPTRYYGSSYYSYPRTYVYRSSPGYYYRNAGYGYGGYYDRSSYGYGRSDYAGNGLFFGALTGAIIGRNSGSLGHNAWRGAAYGAAAGYLIGAVAENNARRNEEAAEARTVYVPAAPQETAAPAVTAPVSAPAAPATPMSSANTLFGRN